MTIHNDCPELLSTEMITAEVRQWMTTNYVSEGALTVWLEHAQAGGILLRGVLRALTLHDRNVVYPADWWQAVKARWFPAWLLHRTPARTKTVEALRVCPHIAVRDQRTHFLFLREGAL